MDYKTKRRGSYEVEATFTFDAEEIEEAYQAAFQKARRAIKLDGFRRGKAPLDLIEKMVGDDNARQDAVEYLLQEKIFPVFDELDPKPISLPKLNIKKLERNKPGLFTATYEAFPVYKTPKFKKIKVTKPQLRVPDRLIEEELKRLQKEEGLSYTREEGDAVQEGDILQVHLQIFDGEKRLVDYESFRFPVFLKTEDGEDIEDDKSLFLQLSKAAMGLKTGETGEIEFAFNESDPMEVLRGKSTKVLFTIKEIKYTELPEINDEFARDVGDYKNLEELREKIRKDLLVKGEEKLKAMVEDQLVNGLVENFEVELPPSMMELAFEDRLDSLADSLGITFPEKKLPSGGKKRKGADAMPLSPSEKLAYFVDVVQMDPKKMEQDIRKSAEHILRQQLAISAIYIKENFGATEEELEETIRDYYTKKFGELNDETWEVILKDEGAREEALGRVKVRKVLDLLLKHAVVKKGPEVDVDKIEAPSNTNP